MARLALGVLTGFAVAFLGVMGATWAAQATAGLAMGDAPTSGYLVMNVTGSLGAALLGGYVAARVAGGRAMAGAILAASMLLLSLGAMVGETDASAPGWYPVVIALVGAAGAAAGGILGARRRRPRRPEEDAAPIR